MTKGRLRSGHNRLIVFEERCKGCGLCIEFCPRHALRQSPQINSKGYHIVYLDDSNKCTGCNICAMICPDFAISVVPIEGESEKTEEVHG